MKKLIKGILLLFARFLLLFVILGVVIPIIIIIGQGGDVTISRLRDSILAGFYIFPIIINVIRFGSLHNPNRFPPPAPKNPRKKINN